MADIQTGEIAVDNFGRSDAGEVRRHSAHCSGQCQCFAVDDNTFFLRDIARRKYTSLFNCTYLKTSRDQHTKYGRRFSLNVYYAADDGFTLTQFPDRCQSEWKDNADWLKLAILQAEPYAQPATENSPCIFSGGAEQVVATGIESG